MKIEFDFSALKKTKWHEYAVRFLFGGAITVATGVLAKYCGPVVGGLFLAFPAIFPAGATLIEKHEEEKKLKAGIPHTVRGRQVATLDAHGAAFGCLGLVAFAVTVWKFLPTRNSVAILVAAMAAWLVVAVLTLRLRQLRFSLKSARRDVR
jgi:hypothetical protein